MIFEVNQVLQILTSVFITLVRDSLTVVALLIYLFYTNWRLTLIVAVILPVIGYLMSKINRRLRKLNRDHQAFTNNAAYVVEEAVGGYKVVKLHGGEATRWAASAPWPSGSRTTRCAWRLPAG